MGKTPDIITPLISFPLTGKALNIIFFTFFFSLVGRGTDPERPCGWGVLISFFKFI